MAYNRWVARQTQVPRYNVLAIECERCGYLEVVGVIVHGEFLKLSELDSATRSIVRDALEDRLPEWPDTRVVIDRVVTRCKKCADEF
ncbi:MAG: hypothetical protein QW734_07640 [Candidatus Bathyarchaeia archaeon]